VLGLAGEEGLVDLESLDLEQGAVGHDLVASAKHEEVVEHDILSRHLDDHAVANDARPGCAQDGETVERALGPHLLDHAYQ
jgi:hypothetical protein